MKTVAKTRQKRDIIQRVTFCPKHKKFFDQRVKLKLSNGDWGINPQSLVNLMANSGECVDCNWMTTFPSLKESA